MSFFWLRWVLCLKLPLGESDDDGVDGASCKQVIVGICAMAKKSESKPMKEILTRLDDFEYIKTIVFPEETILKVKSINYSSKLNSQV